MTFEASRKKQILVLQPKGKPLYHDSNSFGLKMLESMGWKKGNGLGRNQQGSSDFIQVRYKNNSNGLGFDGLKDNQWTETEANFDSLLKNLNSQSNSNSNSSDEVDLKKPAKSLEEMSKKSRARVHYKKFTRGKDVFKYSEKDLANILGKKSLKEEEKKEEVVQEAVKEEKPDTYKSDLIVNTGLSIDEYFKQKKLAKAGKSAHHNNHHHHHQEPHNEWKVENVEENPPELNEKPKKRKKKDKKIKMEEEEEIPSDEVENQVNEANNGICDETSDLKSNKKKKKKREEEPVVEDEQEIPKKKKKSKKHKSVEINQEEEERVIPEQTEEVCEVVTKKKKKKKRQEDSDAAAKQTNDDDVSKSKSESSNVQTQINNTNDVNRPVRGPNAIYSTNLIVIPSDVANKMSKVQINCFKHSNLGDIIGYGMTDDIEIKVVETKMGERINNDKYALYNTDRLTKPRGNTRRILTKIRKTKKSIQVI